MSEAFLVRRNGGKAFGSIFAAYPAGSVCTCTKGSRTLRVGGTGGSYLFLIPESGTWTVKCEDGVSAAEKTVSITEYGQSASVTLAYRTYLFDGNSGGDVTSVTGGWVRKGLNPVSGLDSDWSRSPGGTTTAERIQITEPAGWYSGVIYTKNPIKIDGYSTLHAVCSMNGTPNGAVICIWNRVPNNNAEVGRVARATIAGEDTSLNRTPAISLTGLSSGNYYIGFLLLSGASNNTEIQITEVYLD